MEYKTVLQTTCEDVRNALRDRTRTSVYLAEVRSIELGIEPLEKVQHLEVYGKRLQKLLAKLITERDDDGTPFLDGERYQKYMRDVFG